MSVERIYTCDAPNCGEHVRTAAALPTGYLRLTGATPVRHFCSVDCVFAWSAAQAPDKILASEEATDG